MKIRIGQFFNTGEGGGGADLGWRSALPAELQQSESMKKFGDVGALAKSYTELEALQGSSIRIPGPDAGPDARKAFVDKLAGKVPELVLVPQDETKLAEVEGHLYQRLGRPADPQHYKMPKDLASDVQLDEAALRAAGKGLGLTQKQFEAFVIANANEQLEAQKAERTADAALRTKWGAAYDERRAAAVEVATRLGVPAERAKQMSSLDIELWHGVAQAVSGDGTGEGQRQGQGGGSRLTPDEAKMRAAEIRNRKEYWDSGSPLNRQLVEEHGKLMKLAYPE